MDTHYLDHRYYPKLLLGRALLGLPLLYPLITLPLGPAILISCLIVLLLHANDTLFKQLIDRDISETKRAAEQEAARQAAERARRLLAAHEAAMAKASAEKAATAEAPAPPESANEPKAA